jgi:hypothetical protein
MNSIEFCAGAGGQALGLEQALGLLISKSAFASNPPENP